MNHRSSLNHRLERSPESQSDKTQNTPHGIKEALMTMYDAAMPQAHNTSYHTCDKKRRGNVAVGRSVINNGESNNSTRHMVS